MGGGDFLTQFILKERQENSQYWALRKSSSASDVKVFVCQRASGSFGEGDQGWDHGVYSSKMLLYYSQIAPSKELCTVTIR